MKCRHCEAQLTLTWLDLGSAPPSNAYLSEAALSTPEKWYPLRVMVCENCWLVQTQDIAQAHELFDADYAYFSGFSEHWVAHCRRYIDNMIQRFNLDGTSHIVEVAANDGSLLQHARDRGIPCTGVEPTHSTAEAARAKGLCIVEDFFGTALAHALAAQDKQADLIVANNVLAHVPAINDFVAAFTVLLKNDGVATFEFPHLLNLIIDRQFDTIYHEHFSYLSLIAAERILAGNGLTVFDVEEHATHGGSLRVFAQRADTGGQPRSPQVDHMLQREKEAGLNTLRRYRSFQAEVDQVKNDFLDFLLQAKRQGRMVAAYGAAAKGNTLLNYAGVRPDLLAFVADRNPHKQGKYMPGSRIPILEEAALSREKPDYIVILPWNLREEITRQLHYVSAWNGQVVTAVPHIRVGT